MKAANSSGSNGSTWHIYPYKGKNVESLCDKKTIENVGTRTWFNAKNVEKVQERVDNKIGDICKTCENVMKKRKKVHQK